MYVEFCWVLVLGFLVKRKEYCWETVQVFKNRKGFYREKDINCSLFPLGIDQ